jgi:hypothetical protein
LLLGLGAERLVAFATCSGPRVTVAAVPAWRFVEPSTWASAFGACDGLDRGASATATAPGALRELAPTEACAGESLRATLTGARLSGLAVSSPQSESMSSELEKREFRSLVDFCM